MSQRILSGKWRGMTLVGQTGSGTRPTTSLMRLAIFNVWSALIEGAHFLDLFSGTGAIGFEALSAGALAVTLVEKDKQALVCIRKNEEKFRPMFENQNLRIFTQDVQRFFLSIKKERYDLIYADPPYDWSPDRKIAAGHYVVWILNQLQGCVSPSSRVMIEQERHVKEPIPKEIGVFKHLETRSYGDSIIHHFEACLELSIEPEQDRL